MLPSDSMLVGCVALWLWAPEPNEKCGKMSRGEEKWVSCWSCSTTAILHLHQAARSSATMDYGSSWLTHASPNWITLTDSGRMQLSPMSPFCSTSNANWTVGLTHFGSAAIGDVAFSASISFPFCGKTSCPVSLFPFVLPLLEINVFCFVSGGSSLRLGADRWKWAFECVDAFGSNEAVCSFLLSRQLQVVVSI